MRKSLVLARRELGAYFFSPMAYGIGALFLAVSGGLFFFGFPLSGIQPVFEPGAEASLRQLFEDLAWVMVFVGPLLTMRLMSDEYRTGTIELLSTAPVSEAALVAGKFLGVLAFYVVLLAPTLVFLGLIAAYGQPDRGVAAMGYLGMLLLGSAYLAVGVFTSTVTRYQILAAVSGVAILALLAMLMPAIVATNSPEPVRQVANYLNTMGHFKDFAQGMFDTRGLVFFLSMTAIFLFLSVKALESRRWR